MRFLAAIVALCILSVASAQRTAYVCEVVLDNFCSGNANCPADPTLTFGNSQYGFENFNVVSFGDFYATSGDIEGRAAIKGKLNLPNGAYSFGYQLRTGGVNAPDTSLPFSLVVGGDALFPSGSVYPDGSNFPYVGAKENIFVGGTFTAPSYLQDLRTGGPCATTGCLDADFNNAQAYYNELSTEFNALANNAQYTIQYGGIQLTCNSMADATYVFDISPDEFSTITSWSAPQGCNSGSSLVVNIVGAGSQVTFKGATQTFFLNQRTLYNVVPAGTSTPSVNVQVGVNGNLLAPSSNYNQPGQGVFIGQVIVGNVQQVLQINKITCTPPPTPHNNNQSNNYCPSFETACNGLNVNLGGASFTFRDFNAVVFGDFAATTGDIEGRLAVQGDATFGNGYSVGYELQTAGNIPDTHLPYALIVGGDLNWGSGALYPQGNGIPYPGLEEDMYVGGVFTSSQADLVDRRTGGPCSTQGCLDSVFAAAHTCYTGFASTISSQADNVQKTIEWSALELTCSDNTATDYRITVSPAEFKTFTYTTVSNCNFQARWWITVSGTEDVEITGGSFPAIPGGLTYIVSGTRNIYIHDTEFKGHLLAPDATLNQPNGVIEGKVVVGNVVASKQINKQNTCTQTIVVQVPSIVVASAQGNTVTLNSDFNQPGDSLELFGGKSATVTAVDGKTVTFDQSVNVYPGEVLVNKVNSDVSRVYAGQNDSSSASVVSIAIAALLALIALAF